ncbi:RNA polymerase sigma factor SigM [Kitasatospora kazusensis]|uniref:RNA polymerase sigma factor SigM n=1 Tax=Kitasatospora kazusensis TaxID=407974 RepID=A0ABP5KLZ4_9ACTN
MTAEPSDPELLARHTAGDPDAFGLLVQRHRDRLWAVAVRTLGDREEAADALQDALVSAFRAAHTFEGRSAVTTWLHRIVVNACLDRARRTATRRTGSLDEDPQRLDTLLGSAEPADTQVVRAELRREVTDALAALAPEQRAALVLVDMQGYPVAEAAEVLGVAVGTVKSRCARGRAKLLPLVRHLRAGGPEDSRETPARPEATAPAPTGRTPLSTGAAPAPAAPRGVSRETPPAPPSSTPGRNPIGTGSVPAGTPLAENTPEAAAPGQRFAFPDQALEGEVTPR